LPCDPYLRLEQAPTSGKRTIRSRAAKAGTSSGSLPLSRSLDTEAAPTASSGSGFASTKKDKRLIKHSHLISRIQKSAPGAKKRRRPAKKLLANLESLADALPDAGDNEGVIVGDAIIRQKSSKSRPGALKRKEKTDRVERERFEKNMAQMAAQPKTSGSNGDATDKVVPPTSTTSRWAALRGFVSQTIDQKPEFKERAALSVGTAS
jgi:Ribosome biogenesis protein SLX9